MGNTYPLARMAIPVLLFTMAWELVNFEIYNVWGKGIPVNAFILGSKWRAVLVTEPLLRDPENLYW